MTHCLENVYFKMSICSGITRKCLFVFLCSTTLWLLLVFIIISFTLFGFDFSLHYKQIAHFDCISSHNSRILRISYNPFIQSTTCFTRLEIRHQLCILDTYKLITPIRYCYASIGSSSYSSRCFLRGIFFSRYPSYFNNILARRIL